MAIQDHSYAPDSSMVLPGGNTISSDAAEQTITGEGHVLKMRKPYTITKQRERWAEEEHKKFLEALKLYGRAWRKIEDHVGTKTAVQIRSHAQKFFSKVVRESNSSNSGSIKATEIPPPRPKRKPMHPYPRKLVIPVNKDMSLQEQSAMATSPNLSFDQEHQSPTSVMCEFPSEAIGSEDSGTPDGSSSPMSFHDSMPSQDAPVVKGNISQSEEPVSVKLELSPKLGATTMEGSLEATSPKTLKLFGKTMLLDDPEKAAVSSISLDQQVATKFVDFAVVNTEKSLDHPSAIHYLNSNPQPMEVGPSAPVPYRPFCGGMPFPLFPLDNINSMKASDEDKEACITWPSLTAGSVNAPSDCQMSQNTETQSHEYSLELTRIQQSLAYVSQPKLSGNLKRSSNEKYTRAFMPYKRSLSEKGTQSSTMAAALNNDLLRTRLCLA